MNPTLKQTAIFDSFVPTYDHIDIKTFEGDVTLRQFIAGALSYSPAWMQFLYRVRAGFVRLLGMKQAGLPQFKPLAPADVPFDAGQDALFFTVESAEEGAYWLVSADDSHLKAWLGVTCEPIEANRNRFQLVTLVQYNNWAGPIYFNVIRPFHHLVVQQMGRAGLRVSADSQS